MWQVSRKILNQQMKYKNLIEGIRETAKSCLDEFERNNIRDWTTIKTKLKSKVSEELYRDTKRKPMILPVIMEI